MVVERELYDALRRYFSILSHTGYKKYTEVEKLLVFSFIEELLRYPFSQYITDADYSLISKTVYNLYGSCLIPYSDYKKAPGCIPVKTIDTYRVTEDTELRDTEDEIIRKIAY